jgi:hypothetical protein
MRQFTSSRINGLDGFFSDDTFKTTPPVARFVDCSESTVREIAAELRVRKAGNAYLWTKADVGALLARLEAEDEEEEDLDDGDGDDEDSDEEFEDDEEGDGDDDEDGDEADLDDDEDSDEEFEDEGEEDGEDDD